MATKPERTDNGGGPIDGPRRDATPARGGVPTEAARDGELPPELEGLPAAAFQPLTDGGGGAAPTSTSVDSKGSERNWSTRRQRLPEVPTLVDGEALDGGPPADQEPARGAGSRRRDSAKWRSRARSPAADDSQAGEQAARSTREKPARGAGRSLKMRAVDYLSRREHSRLELSRKLARHAEDPAEVESVLDDMAAQGLLSEARFAESLVNRKAGRLGTSRIVQELRQHGVTAEALAEVRAELAGSELARAREVWRKRFGQPADDAAARAKQMRFLAARGFGHDVIRRVVAGADDLLDAD